MKEGWKEEDIQEFFDDMADFVSGFQEYVYEMLARAEPHKIFQADAGDI